MPRAALLGQKHPLLRLLRFDGPLRGWDIPLACLAVVDWPSAAIVVGTVWLLPLFAALIGAIAWNVITWALGIPSSAARSTPKDTDAATTPPAPAGWDHGQVPAWLLWLIAAGLFGVGEMVSLDLVLLMFAGVTLGGLGTAYGALVGSLVVGVFVQMSTLVIASDVKYVGGLLLLIVILVIRPQGILGSRARIG